VKGRHVVVLGTALARPEIVDALLQAYGEAEGSLAERLLAAIGAAEEASGNASRSAAVVVTKAGGGYRGGNDRLVDVRVDDDPAAVPELRRIYRLHAALHLPAVHIRLGDDLLAAGNRAQAEREYARVVHLYRKAMQAFPTDARFPNALAWFYVRHRVNLDEAFRLADAARRLDPQSWEVEDTLAEIHYARGNAAQAHGHALAALKMEPNNAYLQSQASRFKEALEMSERR
jgi:tetratricopeptide (TPR) repeat protein